MEYTQLTIYSWCKHGHIKVYHEYLLNNWNVIVEIISTLHTPWLYIMFLLHFLVKRHAQRALTLYELVILTNTLHNVRTETFSLTYWGCVTHICVGKLNIIGSDNGLLPRRRQAIIWTNAGILLIRPLGTNFTEILFSNQTFSFKKMHLKMSSAKWRQFVSASMSYGCTEARGTV